MGLGKQAKTLDHKAQMRVLNALDTPREKTMFLLSAKAGLRAIEISGLTWGMVTTADGALDTSIHLPNGITKGGYGGRIIPLHPLLREYLGKLFAVVAPVDTDAPVIPSTSTSLKMTPNSIHVWFHRLYAWIGLEGCSSNSGRRTFITNAVRNIMKAGGTIRDVQRLAGHASLEATAVYIEQDSDAQRRVMEYV